jgi:hypothetical protein
MALVHCHERARERERERKKEHVHQSARHVRLIFPNEGICESCMHELCVSCVSVCVRIPFHLHQSSTTPESPCRIQTASSWRC